VAAFSGFKERVFRETAKIPKGRVSTYARIANAIGSPDAARAVGNALNRNRDKKVPCHRVVRSNGEVGGFARGMKKKIRILKSEGIEIRNGKLANFGESQHLNS